MRTNRTIAGRASAAFTLIELLVVVAIIALLISILLPSLQQAREQGRLTKCLANLKQIGNVMHMYFDDNKEWFPFEKRNWPGGRANPPSHAFYYGGHAGRPGWWGYDRPTFRDTPRGRPFNSYMYQGLSDQVDQPAQQNTPEFEQRRVMPIYACPSDIGGAYAQTEEETGDPLYRETGSSYDSNWQFLWYWAAYFSPYNDNYLGVANAYLQKQLKSENCARFVILYEDPFDVALFNRIPKRGWHRKWNRHTMLFLDGHAAYMLADPTRGSDGTGWKTGAGSSAIDPRAWWQNMNDPDYQYRNLRPR